MLDHKLGVALVFVVWSLSAGCALMPATQDTAACERLFRVVDETVIDAGVRDAGAASVEGFPYLRVNRFLASFRNEVADGDELAFWAERMRRLDMRARRVELSNLHTDYRRIERQIGALRACGQQRLAADLADPERVAALRSQATVDDAYRDFARVLGAYPLAVPFLKKGIADWRTARQGVFEEETPPSPRGTRVAYELASRPDTEPPVGAWLAQARRNPLGLPLLAPGRLATLARYHAPTFVVDTVDHADRLGSPFRDADWLGVEPDRAEVFWRADMTRFQGLVLLQLADVAWFDARPATGAGDPYAGRLDGLIWRVTLDENGRPLVYDSIHPCGCYHQFYPTERLERAARAGYWQEGVFVPQTVSANERVAVWIAPGDHYVQRVTRSSQAPSVRRFRLRRYDRLRLRRPQRLFDATGLIPGSERLERWFLWPSGVRSPGAMRQWGHHATAFVGKRHFDDPFLLERYFRRK